jgi:hypothetical protein
MRECDLSSILNVQSWLGGRKGGAGTASVAFKEDIVAAEDLSRRPNRTNNAIARTSCCKKVEGLNSGMSNILKNC